MKRLKEEFKSLAKDFMYHHNHREQSTSSLLPKSQPRQIPAPVQTENFLGQESCFYYLRLEPRHRWRRTELSCQLCFAKSETSVSVTGSSSKRGGLTCVVEVAASCWVQKCLYRMSEICILLYLKIFAIKIRVCHVKGTSFCLVLQKWACVWDFLSLSWELCPGEEGMGVLC